MVKQSNKCFLIAHSSHYKIQVNNSSNYFEGYILISSFDAIPKKDIFIGVLSPDKESGDVLQRKQLER